MGEDILGLMKSQTNLHLTQHVHDELSEQILITYGKQILRYPIPLSWKALRV